MTFSHQYFQINPNKQKAGNLDRASLILGPAGNLDREHGLTLNSARIQELTSADWSLILD